jgi:hypothetical protein
MNFLSHWKEFAVAINYSRLNMITRYSIIYYIMFSAPSVLSSLLLMHPDS